MDLSPLSRPGENFQLAAEHGGQFVLNVCRSLVHSNSSHCPYQAAACFTRTEHGQVVFDNLGQVTMYFQLKVAFTGLTCGQVTGGPKVSSDGSVYLEYRLGSICMDPGTPKTHMETKIYFLCGEGVYDSEPEYVELEKCHYIFKVQIEEYCNEELLNHCIVDPRCGLPGPAQRPGRQLLSDEPRLGVHLRPEQFGADCWLHLERGVPPPAGQLHLQHMWRGGSSRYP